MNLYEKATQSVAQWKIHRTRNTATHLYPLLTFCHVLLALSPTLKDFAVLATTSQSLTLDIEPQDSSICTAMAVNSLGITPLQNSIHVETSRGCNVILVLRILGSSDISMMALTSPTCCESSYNWNAPRYSTVGRMARSSSSVPARLYQRGAVPCPIFECPAWFFSTLPNFWGSSCGLPKFSARYTPHTGSHTLRGRVGLRNVL